MKYKYLPLLIAGVIGLSACQQEQSTQEQNALTAEQVKQLPDADKQAYALGENMGNYLQRQAEQYAEMGLDFDPEFAKQGFLAAVGGNAVLSDAEATELLQAMQILAQQKQQEVAEADGLKNLEAGRAYLAENRNKDGVMETESGIQYEILTAGDGVKPTAEDTVEVHYRGTLIDGTVFDSSYDRGQPAVFPLKNVIKGWTEGVQLMSVGSKFRFHIPSELAYGQRATGRIKANSTLVFEVELLSIEDK